MKLLGCYETFLIGDKHIMTFLRYEYSLLCLNICIFVISP